MPPGTYKERSKKVYTHKNASCDVHYIYLHDISVTTTVSCCCDSASVSHYYDAVPLCHGFVTTLFFVFIYLVPPYSKDEDPARTLLGGGCAGIYIHR